MTQVFPVLLLVASAALLATAGGLAARHVAQMRRQANTAEEHRIYAGVAALLQQAGPALGPCPECGGRRCRDWRDSLGGATCPPVGSTLELPILGGDGEPGRHRPAVVVASLVPQRWSPLPLAKRVRLAPDWWASRLGRPVQLGTLRGVALP